MSSSTRFWLLLIAGLIAVTVLIGGAGGAGPALDPRSVNPDGARGIVETLETLGATVRLDEAVPQPDASAALMLQDQLSDRDVVRMQDWIDDGGVLVVADSLSSFAADGAGFAAPELRPGDCTIPALAQATAITGRGRTFDPHGDPGCFGEADRPYITARRSGFGTIVSVGGPSLFTNERLDQLDNAYVAITLLAPDPHTAEIAFIGPSLIEFGEGSATGRISTAVANAILMGIAAFVIYALYRARRLGAVVPEPLPVQIRGSELVLQAGVLNERARDFAGTAEVIRSDFLDRWRRELALAEADPATVAAHLRARSGIDANALTSALTSKIDSDEDLVTAIAVLDRLDDELLATAKGPKGTP